jgi:hypothetical protein
MPISRSPTWLLPIERAARCATSKLAISNSSRMASPRPLPTFHESMWFPPRKPIPFQSPGLPMAYRPPPLRAVRISTAPLYFWWTTPGRAQPISRLPAHTAALHSGADTTWRSVSRYCKPSTWNEFSPDEDMQFSCELFGSSAARRQGEIRLFSEDAPLALARALANRSKNGRDFLEGDLLLPADIGPGEYGICLATWDSAAGRSKPTASSWMELKVPNR